MVVASILVSFRAAWPWIIGSLAATLLLGGLDDLVPVLICIANRYFRSKNPEETPGDEIEEERSIAIFIPCWRESEVIEKMIRHNVAAIRYRNFAFFIGIYPNDEATIAVTRQLASLFRDVHIAECPHAGPTSKADCLNWIYQRMLLYEDQSGSRFDTVVLHDAEDLIHPDALATINRERFRYAMVQIPVLPLPTGLFEVTHGVYCDEFAEFQKVDMPARQFSGSFIPSNGVGTGFAREILECLAADRRNLIFDPASLTEDYEIGVYIHRAGYRQRFVPLKSGKRGLVVTREYFPRTVRPAIRQRTRWVTGIALQCWERNGWKGPAWSRYWFWRDRKGLLANPLSFLTNVLFAAGLLDLCASAAAHRPWLFAVENPSLALLCWLTAILQSIRLAVRALCAGKVYGWPFAFGVPLRCFLGNFLNCCASACALWLYVRARFARKPLTWLKTEHAYPTREALLLERRDLDDVLVGCGYVSQEQLCHVREHMPEGADLPEYLVSAGMLTEEELLSALSVQTGVPSAQVDHRKVRLRVVRSLPAHVERRFGIVPFGVDSGRLLVATQRILAPDALSEINHYTRLRIEPQLVTRQDYEALRSVMYAQ